MSIALTPNEERDASYSILVHAGSEYPPVRYRAHPSIDMLSTMQNTTFWCDCLSIWCEIWAPKCLQAHGFLLFPPLLTHLSKCYNHKCNHLCDTMWNLWASLCKEILLDNSLLTQIANLYKLSSCWSHARCRNLSISIPDKLFFFATINTKCFREITHAFYIDESAAFRVLFFIPRPSSKHMCFRETTHALNIDDLPAQTYKMGLLFSPKHVTMGLLFCPKIFSFSHNINGFIILSQNIFILSLASLSCKPTKSTWV